ncbi:MAG: D-glycero-beta-D-manno-heptose 1-phosphate adenylyltransferase [Bacteroidales bacterium]|jgi:rfaE bifunctional protein nucleotidyltransferase chain/domain|nr:D-glycero-beta-D-manno-heptose 1-phosphate adenylyltransferase [Bacteroidales bacterium]MDD2687655.1 D-glycero-beta-D-manno-heptose 1-phosphate adenylyltransferase [Bacteroidales bacterium]MDD3331128.1 D-glycero-beta-D-manno-heptose 1-phosphate adenylyltransferase [Bacteroidales bacterium]MDD3691289.1 D-glycero-beta-D-manno-heptose 1-phosphate adenylyltransferase [Bacteroidales bacterium]MDD4044221.1 D-glycero-beta-D-manno-heptose 1-phosphate adenylyltransferase [Bacteroidales bacterium]
MKSLQKFKNKIITLENYLSIQSNHNIENKKVVFTNGCFDILHQGHVDYLAQAADYGDLLIIGLNSDDSIRRIKGKHRPIMDQNARAILLAALVFVDYVIIFEEDTPYQLIQNIKPDILIKGNDYTEESMVGSDIVKAKGGKIITIPLVPGISTTHIVQKIKNTPHE